MQLGSAHRLAQLQSIVVCKLTSLVLMTVSSAVSLYSCKKSSWTDMFLALDRRSSSCSSCQVWHAVWEILAPQLQSMCAVLFVDAMVYSLPVTGRHFKTVYACSMSSVCRLRLLTRKSLIYDTVFSNDGNLYTSNM